MKFKSGDLVWAKFDDYPYWPARIAKECVTEELKEFRERDGVGILFFGFQLTYDLVNKRNIKDFEKNFDLYSNPKNIDKNMKSEFKEALRQAVSKEVIEDPILELEEEKRNNKKSKASKSKAKNPAVVKVKDIIDETEESDVKLNEIENSSHKNENCVEHPVQNIEEHPEQNSDNCVEHPEQDEVENLTEKNSIVNEMNEGKENDDIPVNEISENVENTSIMNNKVDKITEACETTETLQLDNVESTEPTNN